MEDSFAYLKSEKENSTKEDPKTFFESHGVPYNYKTMPY